MAKPTGNNKKSRQQNDEGKPSKKGAKNAKQEPKIQKPKKEPKVKGPAPASYAPKASREDERRLQQLAQDIAAARTRHPMFVDGVEGIYLIGQTKGGACKAMELAVKTIQGKSKEFLVIERDSDRVYIPHVWLFIPFAKCHFVNGYIGQQQMEILGFLQEMLKIEIQQVRHRQWEERQKAAAPAEVEVAPEQKSAEIIPIESATPASNYRHVKDLMKKDPLGRYSLPDEKGELVLELRANKQGNGNEFVVRHITPLHHLNACLVKGSIYAIDTIADRAPELDAHVRALLKQQGITIQKVKTPHTRNKHAHVYENLPNVNKATQLAA